MLVNDLLNLLQFIHHALIVLKLLVGYHTVNELTIVVQRSILLGSRSYSIKCFLQYSNKVCLMQRGKLQFGEALFPVSLDEWPQRLNAVQFWAVAWHELQYKVILFACFFDYMWMMCWVVIQHQEYWHPFQVSHVLTNFVNELHNKLLIRGTVLLEHRPFHLRAYCSIHSDVLTTVLVKHKLYRSFLAIPRPGWASPHVERSFIKVTNRLVLAD